MTPPELGAADLFPAWRGSIQRKRDRCDPLQESSRKRRPLDQAGTRLSEPSDAYPSYQQDTAPFGDSISAATTQGAASTRQDANNSLARPYQGGEIEADFTFLANGAYVSGIGATRPRALDFCKNRIEALAPTRPVIGELTHPHRSEYSRAVVTGLDASALRPPLEKTGIHTLESNQRSPASLLPSVEHLVNAPSLNRNVEDPDGNHLQAEESISGLRSTEIGASTFDPSSYAQDGDSSISHSTHEDAFFDSPSYPQQGALALPNQSRMGSACFDPSSYAREDDLLPTHQPQTEGAFFNSFGYTQDEDQFLTQGGNAPGDPSSYTQGRSSFTQGGTAPFDRSSYTQGGPPFTHGGNAPFDPSNFTQGGNATGDLSSYMQGGPPFTQGSNASSDHSSYTPQADGPFTYQTSHASFDHSGYMQQRDLFFTHREQVGSIV